MRPIDTASHARTASRRVLAACAILRRAGCTVVAASANGRQPLVVVDRRPPIDWMQFGYRFYSPDYRVMASRLGGVQIECREVAQ